MKFTQRVLLNKHIDMSDIESRTPRVRSSFKAGTLRRRTPIGTAVLLALAPVSLLTVSSAANATLVDNLVYSSQLPQNLGPLVPSVASGLTPGQLIVSGPVDGMTPTDALGTNSVAIGVNAHAMGDYAVAAGSYVNAAAGSVAVGTGVYSNGNESTSLGVRTDAESDRSLAGCGNTGRLY